MVIYYGHVGAEDYKQDIDDQLLSELDSLFCGDGVPSLCNDSRQHPHSE